MTFRVGQRIRLIRMDPSYPGPDPITPGSLGIVTHVSEGAGKALVGVQWYSGRVLSLLVPPDAAFPDSLRTHEQAIAWAFLRAVHEGTVYKANWERLGELATNFDEQLADEALDRLSAMADVDVGRR